MGMEFFSTWADLVGRERAQNEDDDASTRVRLGWAESDGGLSPPSSYYTGRMRAQWAINGPISPAFNSAHVTIPYPRRSFVFWLSSFHPHLPADEQAVCLPSSSCLASCQSPPPASSSPSACETLARRSREASSDVGVPEGAGPRGRRVGAAVPGDDGEPRAAVGVRPQDLCHPLRPARHDGRRLRLRRQGARHLLVLRLLQRRDRALHLPPHPAPHRAVPSALLPPEASGQSAAARPLHRRHQLLRRHDMRLHQRKSHFGGCNSYSSGGDQLNCLHFLGCKEGPRLRIPWTLPICCSHGAHGVFTNSDLFPTGQDLCDDIWWTGGAYLQWLHHL